MQGHDLHLNSLRVLPKFHQSSNEIDNLPSNQIRFPVSPTQINSLKMVSKFPREIFHAKRVLKFKKTADPQIGVRATLQRPEGIPIRKNLKVVHLSNANTNKNNILADMKKLKMECAQIFHDQMNSGSFLPEINTKPQFSHINSANVLQRPVPISPRVTINMRNEFYFNGNSARNLNICGRFNPENKRIPIQMTPAMDYFSLNSKKENPMYQTGHFFMEENEETKEANSNSIHGKYGICSAPPGKTLIQRAIREGEAMNLKSPKEPNEKPAIYCRKYKYVKKEPVNNNVPLDVTFSKDCC